MYIYMGLQTSEAMQIDSKAHIFVVTYSIMSAVCLYKIIVMIRVILRM